MSQQVARPGSVWGWGGGGISSQVPGRGSRDWEWGRGRGGRGVGWGTFEYVLWTQGAHHTAQLLHDQEDAMSGPPSLSACYTDKNFSVHV